MEIETVSIEVIKPSQPTPSNHRSHQLSIFDQFIPHAHLSVPFFSPPLLSHQPHLIIIALLKSSLSKALTLFYPLAGRLKSDSHSHIDCNDEGVKFVHARVRHCSLSQALSPPRPHQMMRQLFPIEHTIGGELLGVQVSFFDCGGIAIGVYLSHKVADPPSLCTFVLSWASIAKSGSSALKPIFDVASVFPPINDLPPCSGDETEIVVPDGRVIVDKVFRFEASKIAALKAKAKKAKVDEEDPTKMMAVAAFLWTIFSAIHGGGKKGNDNNNNTNNCCKINWNLLRTKEGNRRLRTSTTTNYYYKGEKKK